MSSLKSEQAEFVEEIREFYDVQLVGLAGLFFTYMAFAEPKAPKLFRLSLLVPLFAWAISIGYSIGLFRGILRMLQEDLD